MQARHVGPLEIRLRLGSRPLLGVRGDRGIDPLDLGARGGEGLGA
ncbi:hypothetical protein [Sinomonas humi]|nr:hypothetical protein [Sinomonas humi]